MELQFINYEANNKNNNLKRSMAIELDILFAGLFPHHEDKLLEFPQSLHPFCGRGIGIWQYPRQFSEYVDFLLTLNISSYMEVGVAAGGTFRFLTEFLSRYGNLNLSKAVDIAAPGQTHRGGENIFTKSFVNWLDASKVAEFVNVSDPGYKNLDFEKFDLIMIDGDHSYEGVLADFIKLQDCSKRYVFHDIVNSHTPGVTRFWEELKSGKYGDIKNIREFTYQYPEMDNKFMGIGYIEFED